jgi:hypothetical protein
MGRKEAGFSLVEVALAAAVLTVGTLGFLATMTTTLQMESQSKDTVIATRAAQDALDEMWNLSRQDYGAVYETFGGAIFDVEGLDCPPDREAVGTIIIYRNEAVAKVVLDLSLDLDLDRNGIANENSDKAPEELRFLPVRVHLEWQTPFGRRIHDLDTFIYNREED